MCAHYQVGQGFKDFLSLFDIEPDSVQTSEQSRPTDTVPVLRRNRESNQLELVYPRWGLVPPWLTAADAGAKMIHARIETVAEKPAYREAFRTRRCIMPMALFFEYDRTSRYRISMQDGATLGVAGIWENDSCAMITTPTNELIGTIHTRMPAILRPEDYVAWLDPKLAELDKFAMLQPRLVDGLQLELDGPRGGRASATQQPQPELF
jgi:putative SOS response-associated peptidase YedK